MDSQTFPIWRIYPYNRFLILISHIKKSLSSPCVSVKNPHDGHEYQEGDAGHTWVWFQTVWQGYNLLNKRAIWSIDGSIELLGQQLKKEPFVLAFAKDGGQTTSFISTSWRYYAKLREFSTIGAKPSFQSRSWWVMMLTKWVKGLNRKKRWALPLHDHDCPLQDESPQPGCSWPTPLLGLTMGGHDLLGKKINLQDVDSNRPSYWRSHTRGILSMVFLMNTWNHTCSTFPIRHICLEIILSLFSFVFYFPPLPLLWLPSNHFPLSVSLHFPPESPLVGSIKGYYCQVRQMYY